MPKERIVVGIDVGSTKVATLIAAAGRGRHAHVVGSAVVPSRGIKKGVVVDIDEAARAILASIERAERVSGHQIGRAVVSISGGHLTSLNNRAYVAVTRSDHGISEEDVARVVDAARVINVPSNREILHAIPRQFVVDGQPGVRNPIGMRGHRLDAEVHLVTGAGTAIHNLIRCLGTLGVPVENVLVAPLAAGEAVLSEEEKAMGVALVDVGGGTTGVAVYRDGSICHTGVIAVGGGHVTNDIAVHLRTPVTEAEDLKLRYAHAYGSEIDPDEEIEVASFGRPEAARVSRRGVCEVAEARLQETFQLVGEEIQRAVPVEMLAAGIVLVGGTALLSGIVDLAGEVLGLPTRVGRAFDLHGLVDSIDGPAYAAAAGLVLWPSLASERYVKAARPYAPSPGAADGWEGADSPHVGGRIKGWLRTILPGSSG